MEETSKRGGGATWKRRKRHVEVAEETCRSGGCSQIVNINS